MTDNAPQNEDNKWNCPGSRDLWPKDEIQFLVQSLTLIIIISVSLYNLSVNGDENKQLWIMLLSCSFGIIVPNPGIKKTSK